MFISYFLAWSITLMGLNWWRPPPGGDPGTVVNLLYWVAAGGTGFVAADATDWTTAWRKRRKDNRGHGKGPR